MSTNGRPIPELTSKQHRNFWVKVDVCGEDGPWCWEWTAARRQNGYGHFQVSGGSYLAHRISYAIANGAVPAGLVVDHLCNNHACVRPGHLEAVSNSANTLRGLSPAVTRARHAARVECPSGHAYSDENTYTYPSGARACRICQRASKRASKLRLKMERAA